MAYDSRTDRKMAYGNKYAVSWNGMGGKAIKRRTNKKLRRMQDVTRQHEMFGKRVYCRCCCTDLC